MRKQLSTLDKKMSNMAKRLRNLEWDIHNGSRNQMSKYKQLLQTYEEMRSWSEKV